MVSCPDEEAKKYFSWQTLSRFTHAYKSLQYITWSENKKICGERCWKGNVRCHQCGASFWVKNTSVRHHHKAGLKTLPHLRTQRVHSKVWPLNPTWTWKLLLCLTLCNPMGYTVHGILQARILEWVVFPFSRGSSQPRDQTQGSNPGLPHCSRILYQLSHKGSPRILEWVAYPFSSRSSQPRNRTGVSCIAGGFFTSWAEGSLKESNQATTELTHHALILHFIGREGPELGSCRVHSRLPWVQPIKENELQKSSRKQGPHTYKCFPLRLCREHTGLGV